MGGWILSLKELVETSDHIDRAIEDQRQDTGSQLGRRLEAIDLAPFGFVKKISHRHIQRDRDAAQGVQPNVELARFQLANQRLT
jgi:hypothetical protein